MTDALKYSEEPIGEEFVKGIYNENVSALGRQNAPTLSQTQVALRLNIDPKGKFRCELSDLIGGILETKEQERLEKQMRGYLCTLYAEDDSAKLGEIPFIDLQNAIMEREEELMRQFPIGSYIHFGKKNGIIGSYFKPPLANFNLHNFSLRGSKGSTYSLGNILNATRVTEFVDLQAAAMPALEQRIRERIKVLLSQVEFIDLSTAINRTHNSVMRSVKPKARKGTLNPATLSDDEIDVLIRGQEGKTY